MSPRELAAYLGVPLATVYNWRTKRYGPRGYTIGRHVRYRLSEVDAWIAQQAEPDG